MSFDRPGTPDSDDSSPVNQQPPFATQQHDDSDEDYGTQSSRGPRKQGGYDSRIEQILYEHPELEIFITDAGKSHETGGGYIVYTIRTGVSNLLMIAAQPLWHKRG